MRYRNLAGFLLPFGLVDGPGQTLPQGGASVEMVFSATGAPMRVLDEGGQMRGSVDRAFSGELRAALGVGWGLELTGRAGAELLDTTFDPGIDGPDERTRNLLLGGRFRPFGGPFRLSAEVAPETLDVLVDGDVTARAGMVTFRGSAGFRHRDERPMYGALVGDAVAYLGGADLEVSPRLTVLARVQGEVGLAGADSPAEWLTGVRARFGVLTVTAFGGIGLGDEVGAAAWKLGLQATVRVVPGPRRREPPPAAPAPVAAPAELPAPVRLPAAAEPAGFDPVSDDVRLIEREIVLGAPVFFDTDRFRVRRAFWPTLEALADFLVAHPEIDRVEVAGHADLSGPADWNEELSQRRARAVVRFLVERGIAPGRLVVVGLGARHPVEDNHAEPGRARNRRVVFMVVPGPGPGAAEPSEAGAPGAAGREDGAR